MYDGLLTCFHSGKNGSGQGFRNRVRVAPMETMATNHRPAYPPAHEMRPRAIKPMNETGVTHG